ncbi:unnamed protein product [Aphanomyces euteiches]|uniref:Uncharacterized protein n=1 Tax=Aphanomyces euteiches TaxID=100861 RepID=A0A6G0XIS9_9STRA|nr:hypothetical protein Ae201684_004395 [Aphanomyces euteiches]KAH9093836.1 hypothetical protein Ae201684P_016458 [Aphanomyces euteiches]KAH9142746.1 hypothetical protein AeRB84_013197 [Aphanomyces euteiches]KAH9146240.1 hypothetical protein AeRB84_009827 [Aphanomyces euteiches]
MDSLEKFNARKTRLLEHELKYPPRKVYDAVKRKREENVCTTLATGGGGLAGYWVDIRNRKKPIPRQARMTAFATGMLVATVYYTSVKTVFSLRTYYEDYRIIYSR